jgi:hypothetical protein
MILFTSEFHFLASILQQGGEIELPRRPHEAELLAVLFAQGLVRRTGERWALTLSGRVATHGGKWRPGLPLDLVALPLEAEQN